MLIGEIIDTNFQHLDCFNKISTVNMKIGQLTSSCKSPSDSCFGVSHLLFLALTGSLQSEFKTENSKQTQESQSEKACHCRNSIWFNINLLLPEG